MAGGGWWCCCGCWVFIDLFNRAASTNLGADWNEVVGNWDIIEYNSEGMLHEVYGSAPGAGGTANALVICNRAVPIRIIDSVTVEGEMFIRVAVVDPVVGDKYYIYPCCLDNDSVGALVVEFIYTATNSWTINIGSDTLNVTKAPDPTTGEVPLAVCADHTRSQIKATVGELGISSTLWSDQDPGAGQYAGLGHDNPTTGAIFNDFYFGELRTPSEICTDCFCTCDNTILPPVLHGTFKFCSPTGNVRMACMEDITWTMTKVSGLTSPIWSGSVEVTTVETPPVVQTIYFTLLCTTNWQLDIVVKEGGIEVACACFSSTWYSTDAQSVSARLIDDDDPPPAHYSTCDPLSLVYGPWTNNVQDDCNWCHKYLTPLDCVIGGPPADPTLCNGEFWIVITE